MARQRAECGSVPDTLIEAYFDLIEQGIDVSEITARKIALRAGVSVSAINYHFASMDEFVARVGQQAYARVNLRRVELLLAAIQRNSPMAPDLHDVLDALVRPTASGGECDMLVLQQVGRLLANGCTSAALSALDQEMVPHHLIVDTLQELAPWLSRAEVGWRVNAILGIRSQVLRRPDRTRSLTEGALKPDDSESIVLAIVDLAVPMFASPDRIGVPRLRF